MPKPIKKKVSKKNVTQQEVISFYKFCKNYYKTHTKIINILILTVLIGMLVLGGEIYYSKNTKEQAMALVYEGYKTYHKLYQKKKLSEEIYLQKALENFKKSYEKYPSPISLLYIANIQYKLNQYDNALQSIKEFIKKFSNKNELIPLAYYRMAIIQIQQKKNKDALNTLQKMYENSSYLQDLAIYESAKLLEAIGKTEQAKKYYNIIVNKFPGSPYRSSAVSKIKKTNFEQQKNKDSEQQKKK